jgi:hypothetical protein
MLCRSDAATFATRLEYIFGCQIDDPGDKNDPRTTLFLFRSAGWCGPTPLASDYRAQCLHDSLHQYNRHRLNASLEYQPPITRVPVDENNLVAL